MKYCLFIIIFIQTYQSSSSQPKKQGTGWVSTLSRKLYLQTDRQSYITGDTVWAKAFLNTMENSCPVGALMIDMFDMNTTKKIYSGKFSISKNMALAAIFLTDDLPNGEYMLSAYVNCGNTLVAAFSKTINIYSVASKTKEILQYDKDLAFYPEGGVLILGDTNNIAFKFFDKIGRPFDFAGKIYNSSGKLIRSIKTTHMGRGTFNFVPLPNERYYIQQDDDKSKKKYPLPSATHQNASLRVQHTDEGVMYVIKTGAESHTPPSFITVQTENKIVYANQLKNGSGIYNGNIPTKNFPSGVARLAVFTKDTQLLAERLFFVDSKEYVLSADFQTPIYNTGIKEQNLYSLNLQNPSFGTFAISVTDANFETGDNDQNILSAFLLTNYLKDRVYNPASYFDSTYNNPKQLLDLIVQTNQWNMAKWEDRKAPPSSLISSPGAISGTVIYKESYKPYRNKPVSLVTLSEADSSTLTTLFNTDSNGRFITEPLQLIDKNRLTFSPTAINKNDYIFVHIDEQDLSQNFLQLPNPRVLKKEKVTAPINAYDSIANSKEYLEKVTVRAKLPDKLKLLAKKYATGRFEYLPGKIYDLRHVTDSRSNIFDYLAFRYLELQINVTPTGYSLFAMNTLGRFADCIIYLDEVPMNVVKIYSLRPNDVALIKIMPAVDGAYGTPALLIYKRKGDDYTGSDKHYDIKYYNGFSKIPRFYAPVYKAAAQLDNTEDKRITLHWNPTAASSNRVDLVPIHFYNNSFTKQFKIVVEGTTDSGKLLYFKKNL